MVIYSRAHKENKKAPFLKAFARCGNITVAAKAVRISRYAVHDWRQNDPAFASAFLIAKAAFKSKPETLTINDAIDFFTDAIRPYVPDVLWPRIHSRIQIAAADRKFRARAESDSRAPSRTTKVDVSMPSCTTEAQATSGLDIETFHRSF
jgi:hypothetical protein